MLMKAAHSPLPKAVKATLEKGILPELSEIPDDLRPVPGRLFVKLDEVEERTEGGIIRPDIGRELGIGNQSWTGTVLRVPVGWDAEEEGYGEGARIVLQLSYVDVKNGGRNTTIVRKEVVQGVLEP